LETDFIGGGVCLIKADIFKKAGMYESSYFAYFDEIDLSYRLKETGIYRMLVTSKAKIWHNHNWEGKNNNKYSFYLEYYLSERNKFLYYRKYRLYGYLILMLLEDLLRFPGRLWWFKQKCDFTLGMYYIKGMFDGLNRR
jgi:GT2 family glycosyltransferase